MMSIIAAISAAVETAIRLPKATVKLCQRKRSNIIDQFVEYILRRIEVDHFHVFNQRAWPDVFSANVVRHFVRESIL